MKLKKEKQLEVDYFIEKLDKSKPHTIQELITYGFDCNQIHKNLMRIKEITGITGISGRELELLGEVGEIEEQRGKEKCQQATNKGRRPTVDYKKVYNQYLELSKTIKNFRRISRIIGVKRGILENVVKKQGKTLKPFIE